MKSRYVLALMLGMAGTLLSSDNAQAQYGLSAGGCGGGYGAFDVGRLYRVLGQNVPHFAAFPPVYYSAPVPRTYGYSPFAYPPGTMTPEIVEPIVAQEIINPYVPTSTEKVSEDDDKVTKTDGVLQPLVVVNPYVMTRLAGHTER